MADSISIKNRKLTKAEKKLKGKEYYQEQQAKNEKELRDIAAEVDGGTRSSKLKDLSAAKKKEMLEEYEKVIKKLKELELRNKKKENFKHSFKGLKYFPTLNGHSVYSESMQSQAKADKESISAMMAYGQLGAGFDVTFEQMVQYIRPERRQEFLSLCKNNSILSHNLMGMTKVLQFYNQRDFTRAYAAMVFFGLENNMDLMETFLKVKFNADFKTQVNEFKSRIAFASAFEEKEIRKEAGTNVFSQHDSQMTSMQSSYYGKSVSATIQYNSVYGIKTKEVQTPEEIINEDAREYDRLSAKHSGNVMAVGLERLLEGHKKSKERIENIKKEKKEEIRAAATEVYGDKVEIPEVREIVSELTTTTTERAIRKEKSLAITSQPKIDYGKFIDNLYKERNSTTDPSLIAYYDLEIKNANKSALLIRSEEHIKNVFFNAYTKRGSLLQEQERIRTSLKGPVSVEMRSYYEERLVEIDKALSILPAEATVDDLFMKNIINNSNLNGEEIQSLLELFKSLKEQYQNDFDYTVPITVRNGFDNVIKESALDKGALQKLLYQKKKKLDELSETPGNEADIMIIKNEISEIEKLLANIERNAKHKAIVTNIRDETTILKILSGEKEFTSDDLSLILNLVKKEQLEKILGRELSKVEFTTIKQNGLSDKHFQIHDEKILLALLYKKIGNIYTSFFENSIESNKEVCEERSSKIEEKITGLNDRKNQLEEQLKTAEGPEKERIEGEIKQLKGHIETLIVVKQRLIQLRNSIDRKKQAEAQLKTSAPEVVLKNKLTHVVERKLTTRMEIDGEKKDVYLEELSDDQLEKQGITDESILTSVTVVFEGLETIVNLKLTEITQEDMNRVEDGLKRGLVLLEKLKGKIPDSDYEALKSKSEWLLRRVKTLSNKVVKESSEKSDEASAEHSASSKEESQTIADSATSEKSGSDELFAETQGATIGEVAGRSGATSTKGKSENEQENEIVINFKPNS